MFNKTTICHRILRGVTPLLPITMLLCLLAKLELLYYNFVKSVTVMFIISLKLFLIYKPIYLRKKVFTYFDLLVSGCHNCKIKLSENYLELLKKKK